MDPKQMPREMTGAELKSMLKSSINFKSLGGLKGAPLDSNFSLLALYHVPLSIVISIFKKLPVRL